MRPSDEDLCQTCAFYLEDVNQDMDMFCVQLGEFITYVNVACEHYVSV